LKFAARGARLAGVDADTVWIEVFRSPARGPCEERALTLLSLGIASAVLPGDNAFRLCVEPPEAARAAIELARFQSENRPRLQPVPRRLHAGALVASAVYALLLFLAAVASTRSLFRFDWYAAGVLDGELLRSGELWRAVTALTLHADLAHLAANVGFGALFGGFVARVHGAGAGWLLILIAAALANALDGAWMPVGQVSLGASTAVFAALGVLAVHRWPAATRLARAGLSGGSVVAALVLLALLGTGDAHTDILAHALGFACGALLALPLRRLAVPRGRTQRLSALLALLAPALAWLVALAARSGG
jgi:membrane associated rhomboid family serine protease